MKNKLLLLLVLFLVLSSTFFGFSGKAFAWTLEKKDMDVVGILTKSEQTKFDVFQNEIEHNGVHPKEAAAIAGDTKYTKLQGTTNQFEIRLSQGARATFLVDEASQVVDMRALGGHT